MAGLVTLLIPNFTRPLLDAIVMRHPLEVAIPPLWQKLDPVLGSTLVFFLPCVVLAILPPYMIRLTASQLEHVGRISGLIYAANYVGSIAGVFVSGYVLIDYMAVPDIFHADRSFDTLPGRPQPCDGPMADESDDVMKLSLKWAALCCLVAFGAVNLQAAVLFETFSPYHHIQVIDQDGIGPLSFNGSRETRMSLANRLKGHFEYTEYFTCPGSGTRTSSVCS